MQKPETVEGSSLEGVAMLALEFGRLLMECGASARNVDEIVGMVARGLGAEQTDLRIGYASLALTIRTSGQGITRMRKVGPLGVNQRLDHSLRELAEAVQRGQFTTSTAREKLNRLVENSPRYPGWLVDLAVGMACAAFGRLLGVDWVAIAPIFLASALGQCARRRLAERRGNVFIKATLVAFIASALSGLGAGLLGSFTVNTAVIASVLLLIPGVPLLNALDDILEGHPTLGSARAVWVVVILVFLTVGVWLAQMLLGQLRLVGAGNPVGLALAPGLSYALHQAFFGGLAAMGFGLLFNMTTRALFWCGLGGALALAVRTVGLDLGWSLEGASFAAALVVSSGAQILQARIALPRNTLDVAGCIPMVPGGFAAKAMLGLIALTQLGVQNADQTLMISVQTTLRVAFTIGAMGTGLAIPSMLLQGLRGKSIPSDKGK